MTLFHDPGFAAPLGKHIMPISKFALVAAEISREFPDIRIASPRPVTPGALLRVHTPHYIDAVQTGDPRELAESQKFPWSPELFRSVLMTNGGLLAAADSRQSQMDSEGGFPCPSLARDDGDRALAIGVVGQFLHGAELLLLGGIGFMRGNKRLLGFCYARLRREAPWQKGSKRARALLEALRVSSKR